MGGTALIILGEMSDEGLSMASRGGLLSQLLGRNRMSIKDVGEGQELLELPARKLELLKADFINYIKNELPERWDATETILDYVENFSNIYLRGDKNQGSTQWYIQYALSGCSGMAEVSAEVGNHWLHIWYRDEVERITKAFFDPIGFAPSVMPSKTNDLIFVSIGRLGYVVYDLQYRSNVGFEYDSPFELDGAVLESLGENGERALERIEEICGSLVEQSKCLCQMCAPDLERFYLEGLTLLNASA